MDLVGFLACPHKTTLDLINLDTPLERATPDEQVELIQEVHPLLRPTELVFEPAIHDACSQRGEEETRIILSLYQRRLAQSHRDHDGQKYPMTAESILVVSTHNLQVNLLR